MTNEAEARLSGLMRLSVAEIIHRNENHVHPSAQGAGMGGHNHGQFSPGRWRTGGGQKVRCWQGSGTMRGLIK